MKQKTQGELRADLAKRIHMVEGQLEGVIRMLDNGEKCTDVLTQLKAARAGLDRVVVLYLERYLRECIAGGKLTSSRELESVITELSRK